MSFSLGNEYILILEELKSKIRQARLQAAAMLNNHLLLLYWEIGDAIIQQQEQRGWGAKVIENLSKDLRMEFPDFKGLSPRNLHYMKDFAHAYPQSSFLQQPAAKLPWAHICVLLDKVKEPAERAFYSKKAVEGGWSRAILTAQIESDYIHRVGKSITNFQQTLPSPYSDLAIESLKNPYIFDFLSIGEKMRERDLEKALLEKITKFLLELGKMNEFFLDSSYQWQVRPEMPIPEGDISMLFSNLSDEAGLPDQLSFQAGFFGLKWSKTGNMRYTVISTCLFREYHWQITFGSKEYRYNYHE